MSTCSLCRSLRQIIARPLGDMDSRFLGVVARCPWCLDADSAQQGGETDNPDRSSDAQGVRDGRVQRLALVGSEMTVASIRAGGMESRERSDGRVKQSPAGHRQSGDAS